MALSLMVAGVAGGYSLQEEPLRSGQSIEACPDGMADGVAGLRVTRTATPEGSARILVRRG